MISTFRNSIVSKQSSLSSTRNHAIESIKITAKMQRARTADKAPHKDSLRYRQ